MEDATIIRMHCVVCAEVHTLKITKLDMEDKDVYTVCDSCEEAQRGPLH